MNQIYRCFRNLKMNYQVILFGILIMTFVLLLILGTCMIQTQILFQAIQSSSQVITTKQEKRSIDQTAIRIQEYLERKYQQAINNILHVDNFFETTLKDLNLFSTNNKQFPSCRYKLENTQRINIAYDTDSFCYQSLQNQDGITLPNTLKINNFQQTISLLSQYTQLFDLQDNSQLLLFDLPDPIFIISYPQNYQLKNYSVQNRPWFQYYQQHQNQSLLYTPVFLSAITNDLIMMVIKTIYDEQGSSIGFSTQTLKLNDNNIQAIPINIILADLDGIIVLTSIDSIRDAKQQILIYNQSYTGFNESDWELIKARSNNVDLPYYQCSGFSQTFCLFNKQFVSNVQIEAIQFRHENFILVVFVNVTFSTQLEQQYKQLTNALSSQIVQIEWILIITCFVMITITSFMTQILFLPLFHLMKSIRLHIKTLGNNMDKQIFTMSRKLIRQSNIFSKLSIKFLSIQDVIGKKSQQKSDLCQKIERFQYNRKQKQYDSSEIKQIISNLDQLSPRSNSQLKSIRLNFFQFYNQ